MASVRCDHCLLQTPEHEAVFEELAGVRKAFCCQGCRGIYRLILDQGLGDFYTHRRRWEPGPQDVQPLDLPFFEGHVRREGRAREIDLVVSGIRCASCIWLNEKVLRRTPGVLSAELNYATHRARIRWEPEHVSLSDILERIRSIGYNPKPHVPMADEGEQAQASRERLVRLGTACFFSMQLMLYSIALYAGYFQGIEPFLKRVFQWIAWGLATPVLFYSGRPIFRAAWAGFRQGAMTMDLLVGAGAGAAYLYSIYQILRGGEVYFDTAAMIITLILLGRHLELNAKRRAAQAIYRLFSLNPSRARVVRVPASDRKKLNVAACPREMVPMESVQLEDWLEVRPGETVPLDGVVVTGSSEVDESMLTGESRPVAKAAGAHVFCGTRNLYGNFIFAVRCRGEETVLAQIIRAVENAQARRAPVQRLADRVAGLFVPLVILLGFLTVLYRFSQDGWGAEAVMTGISVLVIACPCALGLATPLAILMGTTAGARRGILIKGGDVMERLRDIDWVAFDKTGTLTQGKAALRAVRGIGIEDREALKLAASMERLSEHAIGRAIVDAGQGEPPFPVTGFTATPGAGIAGEINGRKTLVGSRAFLESHRVRNGHGGGDHFSPTPPDPERAGATVVYLAYDGHLAGVLTVSDTMREEVPAAVAELKYLGVPVLMLTGDHWETARALAREAGIDEVVAEVSPLQKAETLKRLQQEGHRVCMVGDGINDAPALVQANVGVAVGRATDIALDSADMVLMRSDLGLLPDAFRLARKTMAIVRQNLFWAFAYNVVAVPFAMAGKLHPILAAAAMVCSSLSVVGNSIRVGRGLR